MQQAAITIDVDSIVCYQRIYGLSETPQDTRAYTIGLSRFIDLCKKEGIVPTLFVVAEDLALPESRQVLSDAISFGAEIGNHSFSHNYRLTKLPQRELEHEIAEAKAAIEDALGVQVLGFRAPGYNVNRRVFEAIARSGHFYDSSIFPCKPYFAARAAAIAALALRGRKSHSLVGDLRVLKAPRKPYKASLLNPWRKARHYEQHIVELPISVAALPFGGMPALGSLFALSGNKLARALYLSLRATQSALVFEFHAADFLDLHKDSLPKELAAQPDLAVPIEVKLSIFSNLLQWIKRDYEVKPLRELARGIR